MLKVMRKNAKFFYVFFFLIIITFIFWGANPDDGSRQTQRPVITVGDQRVEVEQYWRAYDRVIDVYRQVSPDALTEPFRVKLKDRVLNDLLTQEVLYAAAQQRGLMVTDKELQESIMAESAFQDNGVFNRDLYMNTIKANRLTPKAYEALTRRTLMIARMRHLVTDAVSLTPTDMAIMPDDPEIRKSLTETVLEGKREAALRSYVDGFKKSLKVEINKDLIAS